MRGRPCGLRVASLAQIRLQHKLKQVLVSVIVGANRIVFRGLSSRLSTYPSAGTSPILIATPTIRRPPTSTASSDKVIHLVLPNRLPCGLTQGTTSCLSEQQGHQDFDRASGITDKANCAINIPAHPPPSFSAASTMRASRSGIKICRSSRRTALPRTSIKTSR